MTDGFMEPHPLWEYPSFPLSDVYEIFCLEFDDKSCQKMEETHEKSLEIGLKNAGLLNGVAIWSVLEFDQESYTIDTGLLEKPIKGQHLKWSRDFKQAVHILENKTFVNEDSSTKLNCAIKFEFNSGNFKIEFKTS